MKAKILYLMSIIIILTSCRAPSDPEGKLNIVQRLETIDTGGECVDLDVSDSLLVVAANYNGFIIYNIYDSSNGLNPTAILRGIDMAPDLGDDKIEKVFISDTKDLIVMLDKFDKIYISDKKGLPLDYMGDGEDDCYGGAWVDIAIDDKHSEPKIYALIRHQKNVNFGCQKREPKSIVFHEC